MARRLTFVQNLTAATPDYRRVLRESVLLAEPLDKETLDEICLSITMTFRLMQAAGNGANDSYQMSLVKLDCLQLGHVFVGSSNIVLHLSRYWELLKSVDMIECRSIKSMGDCMSNDPSHKCTVTYARSLLQFLNNQLFLIISVKGD